MRIRNIQTGRVAVMAAALALVATVPGGVAAAQSDGEPVAVCELAYYTGGFADYGSNLSNDVRFPIEAVINLDPPLGRPWVLISEDIGDSFEGQAAKKCVEQQPIC